MIFLIAVFLMKALVVLSISYIPFLSAFAFLIFSIFEGKDPRYEIVVVLFIFPLVMNVTQALLTDSIIKEDRTRISNGSIDLDDESLDSVQSLERLVRSTPRPWTYYILELFGRKANYLPLDTSPP